MHGLDGPLHGSISHTYLAMMYTAMYYIYYRIARSVGGVKLWRISKILHWRKKRWRITNLGDQAEI